MGYSDTTRNGASDCTGCKLCALPCPVFRRTQDLMLTMYGRMKALQRGATPAELTDTLDACLLCGACDAVCPEDIDTIGILMDARRDEDYLRQSRLASAVKEAGPAPGGRARAEAGLEGGFDKSPPSPGKELLQDPAMRRQLGAGDLLVVESRAYHAGFKHNAAFYHRLREETGCHINLDLQRAAIPTGAASLQARLGMEGLELEDQVGWLLEGRELKRIIVEDPQEKPLLEKVSGVPVLLLSELAP